MSYASYLPANRAVLFANLGQALNNGEKFPDLFESAAELSPDCYRRELEKLATSIREEPEMALLELIKRSSVFLSWELRYIQLGLATLRISEVFARLCDYYVLIGEVSLRLIGWLIGTWILLSFSLGFMLFSLADISGLGAFVAVVSLSVMFVGMGWLLMPLAIKNWIEPNSAFWLLGARIPILRSMMVARSVYQYLLNLGLCIQGGFDLGRSLQVTAKSEPVDWLRQRYHNVAEDVAGGAQVSKAFLLSGILTETKILATENQPKATGAIWDPGITEVVRHSFARQLNQVAWILPLVVLVPLATLWAGLLLTHW